jgi:uncharacterized protein YdeI (YjbR/CyaY-like superfamily)
VSPIAVARAVPVASAGDLDAHAGDRSEVVVAILNRRSGRQTVSLAELQEVALCHGWVDTQTRRIDDARYAIRFVPRRPRSHWSPKNRAMARRLLVEGRIRPSGLASLPKDL